MICQKLVRLFVDDCLLYRPIRCHQDHVDLQDHNLEKWVDTWYMRYNATTCYILSVKKSPIYCHKLGNSVLEEVENNSYIGLSISNDLKWTNHIYNICKKTSSTLEFIRRNLRHSPAKCRRKAYVSLIRSTLEYEVVISDIDNILKVQHQVARIISTGDYKSRDRGYVTRMPKDLELPLLDKRRNN